jgi:hypothetical protein
MLGQSVLRANPLRLLSLAFGPLCSYLYLSPGVAVYSLIRIRIRRLFDEYDSGSTLNIRRIRIRILNLLAPALLKLVNRTG